MLKLGLGWSAGVIRNALYVVFHLMIIIESTHALSGNYVKFVKMKGACKLRDIGYPPAGDEVKAKRLTSAIGKTQANILTRIAGEKAMGVNQLKNPLNIIKYLNTISLVDQGFVKKIIELAPKYAHTLGILTTFVGRVTITKESAVDQLIEITENLFNNFTTSVFKRLDSMKGYLKCVKREKKKVKHEFRKMLLLWLECARENSTDDLLECQRDAVKYIRTSSKKFLVYFQSKEKGLRLDEKTIKKAEASLFYLRDYSFLYIVVADTLVTSYEFDDDTKTYNVYFKKYLKHVIDDIEMFKDYMSWTYTEIQRVHLEKNCRKTSFCKITPIVHGTDSSKQHDEDLHSCTCIFDKTSSADKKCNVTFIGRKNHKSKGTPYYYATSSGDDVASSEAMTNLTMANYNYGLELKNFLDVFWKNELFDTASVWNDVIAKAKLKLQSTNSLVKNIVTDADLLFDDDEDDENFSPFFDSRYRKVERLLHKGYY